HNIYYLVDLTNKTFVLRSAGSDGELETSDDLRVTSATADGWLREHELLISEWRVANPNIYEQLTSLGPSDDDRKRQEARKAEEEKKKRDEESKKQELTRKAEEESKRDEDAKRQEVARKAEEDRKREEDARQLRGREEELRRKATAVQFRDNFTDGLTNWDAPSSWEIVK